MINSTILQIKNKHSFLDDVNNFLNWKDIEKLIKQKIKEKTDATGKSSYSVIKMFKIVLLQFFYKLSDRDLSYSLFDRISFRKFTGFLYQKKVPSPSTICRFRNKLIKFGLDKKIFKFINNFLKSSNFFVEKSIIIDSSIIESSRRPKKNINIIENKDIYEISYSKDIEAKWTYKTAKYWYGYKLHICTDSIYGFILNGHITSANRSDMKEFIRVLQDMNIPNGTSIFADKGYPSRVNRRYLEINKFEDKIMYKASRNKPLTDKQKKINSQISPIRSRIERTFGTLKEKYGLYRTKYLGIIKTNAMFLFSAIAFNLRKAATFVV